MSDTRKTPINRLSRFFNSKDFDLEIRMTREALEGDNNATVVLYRVDRKHTQSDNIYNEGTVDGIRYFPPVELPVANYKIDEAENKSYTPSSGTLRYLQNGRLTFKVFNATLTELDADISYGDYIGIPVNETTMLTYVVVNDGIKNFDNLHTLMGYKSFYRTVICAAVDSSEFSGR